jgi:hypothetical protein
VGTELTCAGAGTVIGAAAGAGAATLAGAGAGVGACAGAGAGACAGVALAAGATAGALAALAVPAARGVAVAGSDVVGPLDCVVDEFSARSDSCDWLADNEVAGVGSGCGRSKNMIAITATAVATDASHHGVPWNSARVPRVRPLVVSGTSPIEKPNRAKRGTPDQQRQSTGAVVSRAGGRKQVSGAGRRRKSGVGSSWQILPGPISRGVSRCAPRCCVPR